MADQNTVRVRLAGPLVEGKANAIVDAMMVSAVAEVADYAKYEVLTQLGKVLVNPTGYYESQIADTPVTPFLHRIHDSGVVYGPWLEGISSRNQTTRFKGYHTFRIVQGRISQKSSAIIAAHFARASEVL
jgi:hypothetical protein